MRHRLPAAVTLAVLGVASVVAGGLVAAVTAPLALAHGSWLAAYLVLVCGVGQCAMAAARLSGEPGSSDSPGGWVQVAAWNLGNAAVMVGTLLALPLVVDVGGAGCVVGIWLALKHARAHPSSLARGVDLAYRALLALMIVSIPVGLVLSHLRHAR